jgi:hypothetical protein
MEERSREREWRTENGDRANTFTHKNTPPAKLPLLLHQRRPPRKLCSALRPCLYKKPLRKIEKELLP